jgi:hypothetical protein
MPNGSLTGPRVEMLAPDAAQPKWVCVMASILALAFSMAAAAQRSESASATCYQLESHALARECLESEERKAFLDVALAERAVSNAVRGSGEDPQNIGHAIEQLKRSNAEYRTYRKRQCEAMAALALGGNAASDRRHLCHIELDTRRAADLRRAIEVTLNLSLGGKLSSSHLLSLASVYALGRSGTSWAWMLTRRGR